MNCGKFTLVLFREVSHIESFLQLENIILELDEKGSAQESARIFVKSWFFDWSIDWSQTDDLSGDNIRLRFDNE